jgi:serine/threonine protein kinase
MGLRTGTQLGPYEILSAIGAGGMGEVYRARDTRLDRIVALRALLPSPSHIVLPKDKAKNLTYFVSHYCAPRLARPQIHTPAKFRTLG